MDPSPGYRITRFLVLRLLGLVYGAAFLVMARQALPLIGRDGLLPAASFFDRAVAHFGSRGAAFLQLPSLLWVGPSDALIQAVAWIGAGLALVVMLGYANSILMALLWGLYLSVLPFGQDWYGYGWEIQLLETGFLAIFLCPLLDGRPFSRRPPPRTVIVLLRWLIVRIMLGAGLIKLRGDPCWRDLTCLDVHYETQPIPNPLSPWFHFLPPLAHRAGVLFNHLCELGLPFLVFGPRRARHVAGALLAAFQVMLILSGNLSFLNWLTLVPILACFDDRLLSRLLPAAVVRRAAPAEPDAAPARARRAVMALLAALVALLSLNPVMNLLSGRQAMNASFDRLHLVNTYGAFGSVGRVRREIVFEGTYDEVIGAGTDWTEYEFKCKPGDPMRRPCVVSPYHERLDWQIWFAAMSTPDRYPWTLHLVWKLLHNDAGALGLLAGDPFPGRPPRFVRASLYRYAFAPPHDPAGAWWTRARLGDWIPPLSADDPRLRRFLETYGWLRPLPGPAAGDRQAPPLPGPAASRRGSAAPR